MKKFLIIAVAAVSICSAHGQDVTHLLSLGDCLKQAVESNYSVKIAQNKEQIAANNLTPAPFLPSLTASARQNQDVLNSREAQTGVPDVKRDYVANQYVADLSLGWRLFDGMSMFATYKIQQELLSEGELNLKNSIEMLVADVSQQYYNIITQQNRLEAVKKYLEISMMRYNQAKEKYLIGSISGLEMKQAKIDLNADSSRLVLQQEIISNAYITLYEMMNIDLQTEAQLGDTITPNGSLELDRLRRSALENNTTILLARRGEAISGLDLKVARSARYPTLDLNSGYRFNHGTTGLSAARFSETYGFNWGFTISTKLFDRMEVRRKIRNAEVDVSNSSLMLQQTELTTTSNIMQQYNTYRKNFMMIGFESESADAARLNMEAAMEMYRLGTMSGVEFREIQRSYIEAADRMLSAVFQAKVSEIELLYLSGQLI